MTPLATTFSNWRGNGGTRKMAGINYKRVHRIGVVPKPKESDHQAMYFEWLKKVPTYFGRPLWDFAYAIPNGAMLAGDTKQRAIYMGALKRQGFKIGVSDVNLDIAYGPYHGARFELKRDKKSPVSAEQKSWCALMVRAGYYARIVYGFDGIVAETRNYVGAGRSEKP